MSFWKSHLSVLAAARALVDCAHSQTPGGICSGCGAKMGAMGWRRPALTEALACAMLAQAEGFRADGKRALVVVGKALRAIHAGGGKSKA